MVYANSKECDFLKEKNLHQLAMDFFQGSYLGGDTLCIIRYDKNGINAQFVSGEHIRNPSLDDEYLTKATEAGNRIEHGIEIDPRGKHIAYYVNVKPQSKELIDKYERIPAYGAKTGKRLAWIISGEKICPDHIRSVPAISQSLEKINKLDRYTESAVGKAEQAAKIANFIEHDKDSTGESPFDKFVNERRAGSVVLPDVDPMMLADGLANRITETTSNQTINLVRGSTIKQFSTDIETNFGEFQSNVFDSISAGQDIPPEVAMQKYSSNYSASRAAINSFGYIISIKRENFANQFYIPFYKLWLEYQILTNKIKAPNYVDNIDNFMVTESFSQCRFIGKNMPHIDPLKEAKSIELMLKLKLISREQASELLNMGSWEDNFKKNLEEEKIIPKEDLIDESESKVKPKKEKDVK
jgi:capsid protein